MKVKTKESFITKTSRVISRGPGEVINMSEKDYEEVKDKVEVIDKAIDKPVKDKMLKSEDVKKK